MITGAAIENFKGTWERVDIEFRPLTLLFPGKGARKSSVLHALQFAAEVFGRRNLDARVIGHGAAGVDLGGFQNFVHGHNPNLDVTIGFRLEFALPNSFAGFGGRTPRDVDDPSTLYSLPQSADLSVTIGWSNRLNTAFVRRYAVVLDSKELAEIRFEPGALDCSLFLNEQHPIFVKGTDHSALGFWKPVEVEDDFAGDTVIGSSLSWARHTRAIIGMGPYSAPYNAWYRLFDQTDALPDFDSALSFDADWDSVFGDPQLQPARIPELSDYLTEAISLVVLGPGRLLRDQISQFVISRPQLGAAPAASGRLMPNPNHLSTLKVPRCKNDKST